MRFRPCIDIHNGKVKQIVGGSLRDDGNLIKENFVSDLEAGDYGVMYRDDGLSGGHIILLNPVGTMEYELDVKEAVKALQVFPGGFQIGGGMNDGNSAFFLEKGASHVIVTSYVFRNGKIYYDNLDRLVKAIGKKRVVLDLSCRKRDGDYYVVTDRWQSFTQEKVTPNLLDSLSDYCDEFLIHAVDVEGKAMGIEEELIPILESMEGFPITYAGGIGDFTDLELLRKLGKGKIDFTVGSALDLFGGVLSYEEIKKRFS